MADQIIIELIGDPSGLKPAEEALKELSKVSQENMEAFNKANEAAVKFAAAAATASKASKDLADAAKESSKAIDGISDSIGKSITAISSLNGVIAGGAIRAIAGDFQKWTTEVTSLTAKKKDLQTELEATRAQMEAMRAAGDRSSDAYKALSTHAKSLGGQISGVNRALKAHGVALDDSAKGSDKAGDSTERNAGKLGIFAKAANAVGGAISGAAGRVREAVPMIDKIGNVIEGGAAKISAFGKKLKDGSQSVADHGQAISGLLGHTKELTSALGEVGEAAAKASGNEEAGAEIKKKTAAVLSVLATAQAAVTVATEAATIASLALDAAMWPITLVAAAIALGVAAVYGAFQKFQQVKDFFKPIGEAFDFIADKARNFLSIITFGLVDNAAVHKHKEDVEKIGKAYQKNSDELKKQIDLLEASGAKGSEIAAKRKEQLDSEQKSLESQLELETDFEKKEELRNKLAENQAAQLKNQLEIIEKTAEEQKEAGKSELEIAEARKKSLDILADDTKAQVENLKVIIAKAQAAHQSTAAQEKQLEDLQAKFDGFNNQREKADKDYDDKKKAAAKANADAASERHIKALADAKSLADAKLSVTIAGSKEELDAKIAELNAAAAVELNAAKGNEEMKKLINDKLKQDKEDAETAFRLRMIQDDKTGLEAQLALAKEGSKEEYEIKMQMLAKDRELISANTKLTANEKLKAFNELNQKEDALWTIELNKQKAAEEKFINDKKTSVEKATLSEINELEAKDKLELLNMDKSKMRLEEKLKLVKATMQTEIDLVKDAETKGLISHEAATKQLEKIDQQYGASVSKLEDQITKKKEDADKKQQAMEKKLGAEAINLAKQVADAIFSAQAEKRQQALDDTINKLEAQKDKELSSHHLTAAQKAAIEKKYHAEEAKIKEKAWRADQKAKAEQAIINGLLAVTSALATVQPTLPDGIIAGALALASAGIAVGTILSKSPPKFAKGVINIEGPGTETSDSIAAYLSKGESVITAERTRQYKPILEQIQAGIYQPLPIPMLSTMPRLNDLSAVAPMAAGDGRGTAIDYDKLGRAVAQALPKNKVQKLSFDKKGFSHYLLSESGKIESYNNRYRE